MYRRYLDLSDVNDSMELDSEQVIAELVEGDVKITLEVRGDVRVIFDGLLYRYPSEFPDELAEMVHNDPDWYNNSRVDVGNNNWFELFIQNKDTQEEAVLVDAENNTGEQIATLLFDTYLDYVNRQV